MCPMLPNEMARLERRRHYTRMQVFLEELDIFVGGCAIPVLAIACVVLLLLGAPPLLLLPVISVIYLVTGGPLLVLVMVGVALLFFSVL